MFCPKCGSAVVDGARFCPKCGAPMPMRTPAAGNATPQYGAGNVPRTIPSGTPMTGQSVPVGQAPTILPKRRRRWPAVVATVAVASIAVVGVVLWLVMPAIVGPNYVNPLDFSEEAQVRREFNVIADAVIHFDVDDPQEEMMNYLDLSGLDSDVWMNFVSLAEDQGFDVQEYWDVAMSRVTYSIDWVVVSGDRATVQSTGQLPDFEAIVSALAQDDGLADASSREAYDAFLQKLADPSIPMTEITGNNYFVKRNGKWVLSNEDWVPLSERAYD